MITITTKNGTITIGKNTGQVNVGHRVSVSGSNIIVDGEAVDIKDSPVVDIRIHGDVAELKTSHGQIHVEGNVGSITTESADVSASQVSGSIRMVSGDITCRDVGGSVETVSGDVAAGAIRGHVKTVSGDVRERR